MNNDDDEEYFGDSCDKMLLRKITYRLIKTGVIEDESQVYTYE